MEEDDIVPHPPPPEPSTRGPALVFGACTSQGRAVIEGLLSHSYPPYGPVYGATRHTDSSDAHYVRDALGAELVQVDLSDSSSVEKSLKDTAARYIFLVTTTELPNVAGGTPESTRGFAEAEEAEYSTIVGFFDTLIKAHASDGIERHVVLSAQDNVKAINKELGMGIRPLDGDGSVCAHYSGKGRAGEYGVKLLSPIPGLTLTLLTLPFLHSNFLGFAAPLPDEGATQWTIGACFGEEGKVDMFSETDLAHVVPELFDENSIYAGKNVRVSSERISLEEVAAEFADLFGRDVIYNPLTPREMSALPIPAAGCMAQMCQFLGDPRSAHDVAATRAIMFPRKPQVFRDWLLVNSDSTAFEEVGLSVDAGPILKVAVFGATGLQGTSVVKGLLADKRKRYEVRATARDIDSEEAKAVKALDPNRVTLIRADFDDVGSCAEALEGVEGAFLAVDFFRGGGKAGLVSASEHVRESHARNIIDACEASRSVRHVVFSTMEYIQEIKAIFSPGKTGEVGKGMPAGDEHSDSFDAKARAAAYARTKKMSCTFVLMPCYPELFLHLLRPDHDASKDERHIVTIPLDDQTRVGCMSVDDLGPAVANIFDSYQVYAGHEIGLVTEFVTLKEASQILSGSATVEDKGADVETKEVPMEQWIEARDTYMKDLGQMFKYMSHTNAVKKRHSVARTLKLVPNAKPLSQWVEHNKDKAAYREKLGLR